MAEMTEPVSITRRRLILRDSLTFLSLIAITVVLFAVTLFLFRSFMTHRADLARRWADRGRVALQASQPQQAVAAYRAALSYAPGERAYELMLAQALGDAGRTEEAFNYFTELWETHPGDGSINLQLARLAARKREPQDAVNFYRASIYGTWEGDGVERRRAVRLELAQYLIAQRQFASARAELLIAGGNAPDIADTDLTLAKLLEQADAPTDALGFYRRTLAHDPRNLAALGRAAYIDYALGDYTNTIRLLQHALRASPLTDTDALLLAQSERLAQLQPSVTLPTPERVAHILAIRTIAKKRLAACTAELEAKSSAAGPLQSLQARWTGSDGTASRTGLMRDEDKQNAAVKLVYDTELTASQTECAAATGDDALLLMFAKSAKDAEVNHR